MVSDVGNFFSQNVFIYKITRENKTKRRVKERVEAKARRRPGKNGRRVESVNGRQGGREKRRIGGREIGRNGGKEEERQRKRETTKLIMRLHMFNFHMRINTSSQFKRTISIDCI